MRHLCKGAVLSMALALVLLLLSGCGGRTVSTSGTASENGAAADSTAAADSAAQNGADAEEQSAVSMEPTHTIDIEVEDYGTITAELYGGAAPRTVENFVNLAESGFYDGLTFHRIMDGFMIQGGDPGGSDTTIPGEFASNGTENPISHLRGVLSMARSTNPDSASSQFFIVQTDSTFLDGNYAAFGMVTAGMDVVDAICADAVPLDDNGTIAPEAQPIMRSVTVRQIEPAAD